ncbi:hypothetical protein J8L85_00200 [Maribacter sp. MMG018]|uniref:contact-dependent growth inhibition system immunity protein n=1 Tax=Maribacter sp. MMG018 TaxID=2822688 RepID=UPI001B380D48|nr:contact-dependent growth inhibition system immunity protein [Maribacter sp. MMG018]MBQ4912835.1 hypothetical protein [Maribacter sp. MMG018]
MKSTETKYENNWREKSLDNLKKAYWSKPDYESHLVKTCHQLRKKPLKEFEIEDLRIMIGQNIGPKFLVSVAIEELKENILNELIQQNLELSDQNAPELKEEFEGLKSSVR